MLHRLPAVPSWQQLEFATCFVSKFHTPVFEMDIFLLIILYSSDIIIFPGSWSPPSLSLGRGFHWQFSQSLFGNSRPSSLNHPNSSPICAFSGCLLSSCHLELLFKHNSQMNTPFLLYECEEEFYESCLSFRKYCLMIG